MFVFVLKLCQEAFSCYSCVLSWFFPEYRRTTRCKTKQPKNLSISIRVYSIYLLKMKNAGEEQQRTDTLGTLPLVLTGSGKGNDAREVFGRVAKK